MLNKPKFLDKVKVKAFAYNAKKSVVIDGQYQAGGRGISTTKNFHQETIYTVIGTVNLPQGYSEHIGHEEGYGFKHTGSVQVFIVANTIGVRYKAQLEDMELVEEGNANV